MPGEVVKVLTIARLVEKKGVVFAIEAVAGLLSKGEKLEYRVVGDGLLRGNLQQMIERMGIERQVKLLGWKTHEEVKRLLEESKVGVKSCFVHSVERVISLMAHLLVFVGRYA